MNYINWFANESTLSASKQSYTSYHVQDQDKCQHFKTQSILIFRSYHTPSVYSRNTFWTPTTPTPSHALRPSLSLHNLESKTFTEVLIPTIKPPEKHQAKTCHMSQSNLNILEYLCDGIQPFNGIQYIDVVI